MFHIQPGENMFFRVEKKGILIRKQEGKKLLATMLNRIENKKKEPEHIDWKQNYYSQFEKNK